MFCSISLVNEIERREIARRLMRDAIVTVGLVGADVFSSLLGLVLILHDCQSWYVVRLKGEE